MKKIVKLTESDLSRIVKRVIKENKTEEVQQKGKTMILSYLNDIAKKMTVNFDNDDDHLTFKKGGKVYFRYDYSDMKMKYSFHVMDFVDGLLKTTDMGYRSKSFFSSSTDRDNFICGWIQDYLFPKYRNKIEDLLGYDDFEMGGCSSESDEISHDEDEYYDDEDDY